MHAKKTETKKDYDERRLIRDTFYEDMLKFKELQRQNNHDSKKRKKKNCLLTCVEIYSIIRLQQLT
jgi:hypothetical protein